MFVCRFVAKYVSGNLFVVENKGDYNKV